MKFYTAFLLCCLCVFAHTQSGFEFHQVQDSVNVTAFSCVELDNGNLLFSTAVYPGPSAYTTRFFLLDENGLLLNDWEISFDSLNYTIDRLFSYQEGYIGIGSGHNIFTEQEFLCYLRLNTDLELESVKLYEFPSDIFTLGAKLVSQDSIIIAGTRSRPPTIVANVPFLVTMNTVGEIDYINDDLGIPNFIQDFIERPDSVGLILYGETTIVTTNTYELSEVRDSPYRFGQQGTIRELSDEHYLVCGKERFQFPNDKNIGLGLSNYQHEELMLQIIGKPDTTDFPAPFQCMDFQYLDKIYCGGMSDKNTGAEPSFLVLSSFDSELNKNWERYYGGDAYYYMYGLLATKDGGCVMYGYRYDAAIEERLDLYILKVNCDGVITSENFIPIAQDHFSLFPNPAFDFVKIDHHYNVDKNLTIRVFDVVGKLALQHDFFKNQEISIAHLSAGSYTYQIFDGKHFLAAGKFVKQQ